ncbi:class I SAM-dependent methyltransferase [Dehalobacter sp. DCM]|uniref:DVU_1556 family methyltransferase n=1 Tax=Dehalobacter sp. DCM TaxID=2907827 RepID=UPI003081DB54|nr:class I SAM-dependent methyltransferase [Dehalobacter sp. DCM]
MTDYLSRLYEDEQFQMAAEDTLRPGGLELTRKAMGIAGFPVDSRILDIGCGCGKTVELLIKDYGMQAMGIDISEKLIQKAKSQNNALEVQVGDVYDLPYADQSLNGIFCECTFSLFADKPLALAQINRVLLPGGKLIVSDLYLREKTGECSGLPMITSVDGIATRDVLLTEFTAAGFKLDAWQDETTVYKEFIAGLIMKYGSLSLFWESILGTCEKAYSVKESMKTAKIGYCLSVWEKINLPNL